MGQVYTKICHNSLFFSHDSDSDDEDNFEQIEGANTNSEYYTVELPTANANNLQSIQIIDFRSSFAENQTPWPLNALTQALRCMPGHSLITIASRTLGNIYTYAPNFIVSLVSVYGFVLSAAAFPLFTRNEILQRLLSMAFISSAFIANFPLTVWALDDTNKYIKEIIQKLKEKPCNVPLMLKTSFNVGVSLVSALPFFALVVLNLETTSFAESFWAYFCGILSLMANAAANLAGVRITVDEILNAIQQFVCCDKINKKIINKDLSKLRQALLNTLGRLANQIPKNYSSKNAIGADKNKISLDMQLLFDELEKLKKESKYFSWIKKRLLTPTFVALAIANLFGYSLATWEELKFLTQWEGYEIFGTSLNILLLSVVSLANAALNTVLSWSTLDIILDSLNALISAEFNWSFTSNLHPVLWSLWMGVSIPCIMFSWASAASPILKYIDSFPLKISGLVVTVVGTWIINTPPVLQYPNYLMTEGIGKMFINKHDEDLTAFYKDIQLLIEHIKEMNEEEFMEAFRVDRNANFKTLDNLEIGNSLTETTILLKDNKKASRKQYQPKFQFFTDKQGLNIGDNNERVENKVIQRERL